MYISNNVTEDYQIKNITDETLTISKNIIYNIANRALKAIPLITFIVQPVIIFLSIYPAEGAVLRDNDTPIITTTPALDEVISVAINSLNNNEFMMCSGPFSCNK